jgi:hypothetical protein
VPGLAEFCTAEGRPRNEELRNLENDYAQRPRGRAEGVNLRRKEEHYMQKITPFLWFDSKAEEAMNFYVSVFKEFKDRKAHSIW